MKVAIELDTEVLLNLIKLHHDVMEVITENMANDPIAYSSAARITNAFTDEVMRRIPTHELDRVIAKQREENNPTPPLP